jgi:hypothetical protein
MAKVISVAGFITLESHDKLGLFLHRLKELRKHGILNEEYLYENGEEEIPDIIDDELKIIISKIQDGYYCKPKFLPSAYFKKADVREFKDHITVILRMRYILAKTKSDTV